MATDFRDFQDILTDLDDGHVHEELTQKLRDVVRGVREAQQAGSLSFSISVIPDGRQFVIKTKVAHKIPTKKSGLTVFFADEDGDLRKEDPKQVPLRNVETKRPTELRTIDPHKGA